VTAAGGEGGVPAVSPDGSRLAWEVTAGGRPALGVRDPARGTERLLPVPGALGGPRTTTRGSRAWSRDSRQLAELVVHGISSGYTELMTVDADSGTWRHRFNVDARHGGGPDCCPTMTWPAGSRRISAATGRRRDPQAERRGRRGRAAGPVRRGAGRNR
jgi:hypothetical protein